MLLKSSKLTNFLSYGDQSDAVVLGSLNIVIAPNGSGKSNLLKAIGFFKATPLHQRI